MATARANLSATVSADATQFHATMRRVGTTAKTVGARIGKSMTGATKTLARVASSAGKAAAAIGAVGAAAAAGAIVGAVKNLYDLGGALSDLSSRTGIAVGDLAILQQAFKDNGLAAEKVGPIINKMQKGITDFGSGLSTQVRAFERLGISYDQIKDKNPIEQFDMIQSALAGISNQSVKTATAMEIFGRAGGELQALFDDSGAVGKARTSLGDAAGILESNAQTFDRISDLMQSAAGKLQLFALGIAEVAAPKILEALEKFNEIDFAAKGVEMAGPIIKGFKKAVQFARNAGATIKAAFIAIRDFDYAGAFSALATEIPEILGQGLIKAGKDFVNLLFRHFIGLSNLLSTAMVEAGKGLLRLLAVLVRPDFWKGMGNSLIATAHSFTAIMLEGVAKILDQLSKIPGLGEKLGGAAEKVRGLASSQRDAAGAAMAEAGYNLKPIFDDIVKENEKGVKKIMGAYTDGFKRAKDVLSTKEQEDRISAAVQRLADAFVVKQREPRPQGIGKGRGKPKKRDVEMSEAQRRAAKISELQSSGFGGLAELELMQLERISGIGPGTRTGLSGGPSAVGGKLGAITRSSLGGIGSGLTTGGLGEKRRVGGQKDDAATKRQIELAKSTDEHLMDIKETVGKALTVSQ